MAPPGAGIHCSVPSYILDLEFYQPSLWLVTHVIWNLQAVAEQTYESKATWQAWLSQYRAQLRAESRPEARANLRDECCQPLLCSPKSPAADLYRCGAEGRLQ